MHANTILNTAKRKYNSFSAYDFTYLTTSTAVQDLQDTFEHVQHTRA